MTNLKDIEKRFDELWEENEDMQRSQPEAIKSFYHKEIVQLLEGLKYNYPHPLKCVAIEGDLCDCSINTRELGREIDKLIEEA